MNRERRHEFVASFLFVIDCKYIVFVTFAAINNLER